MLAFLKPKSTFTLGGFGAPKTVAPKAKALISKTSSTGGNAQTKAYGKAMNSAFKNTKTFGMPNS